ncbi:MAG TPA: hypothetical protein VL096_14635 [Pirellulaceae bacterium]|nr:hypothetical protein [Pirellulaceae bacterium]
MRSLLLVLGVIVASCLTVNTAAAQYPGCNRGYPTGYYSGLGNGGYYGSYYRGPNVVYSSGIAPRVYTYGGPGLYPTRFRSGYGAYGGGYYGGYPYGNYRGGTQVNIGFGGYRY